jgi:hypothetical protein
MASLLVSVLGPRLAWHVVVLWVIVGDSSRHGNLLRVGLVLTLLLVGLALLAGAIVHQAR